MNRKIKIIIRYERAANLVDDCSMSVITQINTIIPTLDPLTPSKSPNSMAKMRNAASNIRVAPALIADYAPRIAGSIPIANIGSAKSKFTMPRIELDPPKPAIAMPRTAISMPRVKFAIPRIAEALAKVGLALPRSAAAKPLISGIYRHILYANYSANAGQIISYRIAERANTAIIQKGGK